MIIPSYLQSGDTIGITCPSGYVPAERVAYAVELLQTEGYQVQLGKTVSHAFYYFSRILW
jgi:muramoyltetrapeptide carboxypeptidase